MLTAAASLLGLIALAYAALAIWALWPWRHGPSRQERRRDALNALMWRR